MFILAEMTDTIRVEPWLFHKDLTSAVTERLDTKLANKVVYNLGLCVALHDVTKMEDSFIVPGDGASHTKVHFRYVVFRPFIDEILEGRIRSCSPDGVHVSLGFFDDIIVPPDSLQQPSRFDDSEQVWVWEYSTEDGSHELFMDVGETIRFRVANQSFVDSTPLGPRGADGSEVMDEVKRSPYSLTGSIAEPGLGLISWWNSQ